MSNSNTTNTLNPSFFEDHGMFQIFTIEIPTYFHHIKVEDGPLTLDLILMIRLLCLNFRQKLFCDFEL